MTPQPQNAFADLLGDTIMDISKARLRPDAGRLLASNIHVVAFTDEEGLRFQTTFLGSKALTGAQAESGACKRWQLCSPFGQCTCSITSAFCEAHSKRISCFAFAGRQLLRVMSGACATLQEAQSGWAAAA